MEPVVIGHILGRLLFSYLGVWVVCYLVAKFNYRKASRMLHSKYGVIGVAAVFILPLISGIAGAL